MTRMSIQKLNKAIKVVEERKASSLRCPECKKALALLTLSFRNLRIATVCRFCQHVEYVKGTEEEVEAKVTPIEKWRAK